VNRAEFDFYYYRYQELRTAFSEIPGQWNLWMHRLTDHTYITHAHTDNIKSEPAEC